MKVAISQPMFFPWIGFFQLINSVDLFIHLDDVQMPGGQSFIHRVQLKGPSGIFWWNAPIRKASMNKLIAEIEILVTPLWIRKSYTSLKENLAGLPYVKEVLDLFSQIMDQKHSTLSEFNIYTIELISEYLQIKTKFKHINRNIITSDKTKKIIQILEQEKAKTYISGLGGQNYLEEKVFDQKSIDLFYINYINAEYKQKYGEFIPYVSILLPIAAMGKDAKNLLSTIPKRGIK